MSTLTSFKDGSLGCDSQHMQSRADGSLGAFRDAVSGGFQSMQAISNYTGMQAVSGHQSAYKDGTLGCGCGTSGLGETDTGTLKIVGVGLAAMVGLYLVAEKKLLKANRSKRRRRSRRRR